MKKAIKLSIVFVVAVMLCMLFAVFASAETYTVKYCDISGSSKATVKTDENGVITLRDTSATTNDNKTFYGWFTEDGTFYPAGTEMTLTKDTSFREAFAYVISSYDDLKTYLKSSYRWSLLRLDADIDMASSTGLPGFEGNNGTTCIYFDLNGHTINVTGTGNVFYGKRIYMQFFNSSSEKQGKIIANELLSTDGIFCYEKHGDADSKSYGIVVGKGVHIETTGSLFKVGNDYNTDGTSAGFTCPNVKIWGTVVANSLVNCNKKWTYLSNIDIYSGADVTLTGTTWWLNPRTDYVNTFADLMVEQGAKITIKNKDFSWTPSIDYIKYVEYDISGGTVNVKFPGEFLNTGYDSIYNAETKYYTVEYVACTLEGSNGVHKYAQSEYYDGLAPTCTTSGKAYFRCGCGSFYVGTADALGHDYSIIEIVTPATLSTTGTKKYTCANCGDSYSQDYVVDATGALATVVVKDENGEEKTISVPFNSLFIVTQSSDGGVTLNGIADTIALSETESYTKNDIVKLEIFGVTLVATGAIKDMSALTEITIAGGSKITFETASFDTCASLEKLVLGNGTIATFKQFTVKSSTTNTADNAGDTVTTPTCPNFATIDARNADVTFENLAFRFNGAIKHVLMSEGNTYYFGRFAFHRSALEEVILPDNSTVTLSIKSFAETKTMKYVYVGANCLTNRSGGKISLGDDGNNTSVFGGNAVLSKVVLMDVEYIGKWTLSVKTSGDYAAKNDLYIYSHADSLTFNASDCSINDRNAYNVFIYAKNTTNTPKNCHYVIYNGIPHKYVAEDSQPTCTLPGVAGYTIDCPCGAIANGEYPYTVKAYSSYTGDTAGGTITITGEIIPANGHEFDPANGATLISQTEAKCGEKSVATYKCANCDETTSVEVGEAKAHSAGATTTVPPTCTADGVSQITCSLCQQVMSAEIIKATGHTATGEWVVVENGSCTVGQARAQYCKNDNCDAVVLSETDEPVGHTSNGEWIYEVNPDCLNGGVKYQRCTTCNAVFNTEKIDALGHEFDIADGAVVNAITYENGFDKNGVAHTRCARCDETSEGEIAPIFTAKGYSVNGEGNSLNGGYTVNLDLLQSYVDMNGKVEFGIVIANANSFTGAFFENGKVTSTKALQVGITPDYSNFDCSIHFNTSSNSAVSSLELIITAYVIDAQGNVSYIQAQNDYALDAPIGNNTFTKVTLDLVKANVTASAPVALLPSKDEE